MVAGYGFRPACCCGDGGGVVKRFDHLHVRPSIGPCQVHDWPTRDMAKRLLDEMRARHGKGGINVCIECLDRARSDAKQNTEVRR